VRKQLTESTVLFISIIKWVFLATIAGAIVGGATALFLKILGWATDFGHHSPYTFLLLPIALFLSALSIKYLAPDAEGHGTEKVIEAVHQAAGRGRDAHRVCVDTLLYAFASAGGGEIKYPPSFQAEMPRRNVTA